MRKTIWDALLPYWLVEASETVGNYTISILINRNTKNVHVAWRGPGDFRWHLSPYTGISFAKVMLNFASLDRREGHNKPITFLHRFRIYTREVMADRWKAHRQRMADFKEAKELQRVASYGMF